MTLDACVRVADLVVRREGRTALGPLDLAFDPPAAVVVGPPGSGKTTLLKALAGLLPWEGTVALFGDQLPRSGPALSAARERIGFVFQGDALFDDKSALANVAFPLRARGVAGREAEARAREALAAVGLTGHERLLPERMSGGMRKRLGIARALVARPRLLLADDPLAGLDPATSDRIADLLAGAAELLVVAASDPVPLAAVCPRLVALARGRVVLDGRTADLAGSNALRDVFLGAEAA